MLGVLHLVSESNRDRNLTSMAQRNRCGGRDCHISSYRDGVDEDEAEWLRQHVGEARRNVLAHRVDAVDSIAWHTE
jgi:hypothetical protein